MAISSRFSMLVIGLHMGGVIMVGLVIWWLNGSLGTPLIFSFFLFNWELGLRAGNYPFCGTCG
jgi:hypothetical protein